MTNNIEQMARERLSEQADAMGQWEIGHAIRMGHDSMIVSIALQVIAAALREQCSAHGADDGACRHSISMTLNARHKPRGEATSA